VCDPPLLQLKRDETSFARDLRITNFHSGTGDTCQCMLRTPRRSFLSMDFRLSKCERPQSLQLSTIRGFARRQGAPI
jgi:hypothetical protein